MSHVFISYSHQDQDYATQLAQTLEMEGYSAWIDNRGIDYGAHWPHVIQEALDNCVAFIVIMSPHSYKSEWVQNELSRAQRKQKPILPLLLDGDGPWLMVESKQYADVRGGKMPPKMFYERLGKVAPRKSHDPQESGYFVFNLDSKVPEQVNAPPPRLSKKPRGIIRETGTQQQVNLKPTDSGWFTPDSAPKQAPVAQNRPAQAAPTPPAPQYAQPQQHYGGYQQPYAPRRAATRIPSWMIWAGLGAIGVIGLIILVVVVVSLTSDDDDNSNGGTSQVDVAEDFVRAVFEGDYSRARNLSSCSEALTVVDYYEALGLIGSVSNLNCENHGTDTVYCEYVVNGVASGDTFYMDGNKVCSIQLQQ